ncbi:MAG: hypothetical protein ABJH28_02405 [Paraglaciecola sp.]
MEKPQSNKNHIGQFTNNVNYGALDVNWQSKIHLSPNAFMVKWVAF